VEMLAQVRMSEYRVNCTMKNWKQGLSFERTCVLDVNRDERTGRDARCIGRSKRRRRSMRRVGSTMMIEDMTIDENRKSSSSTINGVCQGELLVLIFRLSHDQWMPEWETFLIHKRLR
jgi:hypothetical protein